MTRPGHRAWVAARCLVAAFCWMTAAYAFVASSAFAYQQFLKPRVFSALGVFADAHAWLFWIWFAAGVAVVWRDLRSGGSRRVLAAGYIVSTAAFGVWNTAAPIVPRLSDGPRSVFAGVTALVPLVWLAVIDHAASSRFVAGQRLSPEPDHRDRLEGRLSVIFFSTAVFVAALYTVRTSIALIGAFEPDLFTRGLAVGFAWSLVNHVLIFSGAFLATVLIIRATGRHFVVQYVVLMGTLVAGLSFVFDRFVGSAIALGGMHATAAAVASAAAIVGTWSGLRLRSLALGPPVPLASGLDIFFGPPREREERSQFVVRLSLCVILAFGLAWLAGWIDWDFLLLKSGVLIVWLVVFGVLYRSLPPRAQLPPAAIAACCALPLAIHAAVEPGADTRHVLERYTVYNPSFRLTDGMLGGGPSTSRFDLYLRANSGFTDVEVPPVSIDFVDGFEAAPPAEKPLIFLFVVDSLRRDYLSPYNEKVRFTPRIAEFASESVTFMNAFTRYGGTGLSMPGIWAGSGLLHKQYVRPFAPMNTLEKLLDANGYRKHVSFDHITVQLLDLARNVRELDRGVTEMKLDFCRTLGEVQDLLQDPAALADPLFVHTRSLNMHVIEVRNSTPPDGETYDGFYGRYAARVHRIDGCFGGFIDFLKRRRLYDRSLIVLTADHGELIGEDGRWGHSYHLYPPVIQVPLIVHVPSTVPARAVSMIDTEAVNLSTDIVPTIYSVLGYDPRPPNGLAGTSLLPARTAGPDEAAERAAVARRRSTFVIPASYGPVYAVLRNNGRRLFIADGVNRNDQAYERDPGGPWVKVEVTEDIRMMSRLAIREYIDEVARTYNVDRPF